MVSCFSLLIGCAENVWYTFNISVYQNQTKKYNFPRSLLSILLLQSTDNLYWRQRVVQKAEIFTKLTAARTKVRSTTQVGSFILMCSSDTTITLWCCVSTGIYVRCYHTQKLTKYVYCTITLTITWRIQKKNRISPVSPQMDKALKISLFAFVFRYWGAIPN
jgi:hypothetical protein